MAPPPGESYDMSEDLRSINDELRRKLDTAEALTSYQATLAERRRLEALDSARPLAHRLAYIEPLYNELFGEYTDTLALVDDLETAKSQAEAKLQELQTRASADLRAARSECAAIQEKLRAAEKELLNIRSSEKASAGLATERNKAMNELADIQLEHQLVVERSKALETELEQVKAEAKTKAKELQSEITEAKKQLKSLQTEYDKAQKKAAAEKKELEAQITSLQSDLEAEKTAASNIIQAAAEKEGSAKTTKKEISDLKSALTKETKAREKAEKEVANLKTLQEESKLTKKELSNLRAALAKETKTREQIEKQQEEDKKALEEEQAERERVEAELTELQEEQAKAAKKESPTAKAKKQLSDLTAALEKESEAREAAEAEVARLQAEPAKPAKKDTPTAAKLKKELAEVKAALEKETKAREEEQAAREKAEADLTALQEAPPRPAKKETPTAAKLKKGLAEVKAALERETKAREKEQEAREKAQADLSALQEAQPKEPAKKETPTLAKLKKELAEVRASLEKQSQDRQLLQDDLAQHMQENQKMVEELTLLKAEIEAQAATKETAPKAKNELTDLKTALAKETKAREKAERDFARFKEDQESKHEITQKQLDAARAKVHKLESAAAAKSGTTTTKVPLDNPRKRTLPLTMDDLENSTKKPRTIKAAAKESEFSVTPFLKRQVVTEASVSADVTVAPADETVVPAVPADKPSILPAIAAAAAAPVRNLFAARKKKPTAKETEEKSAPPAEPAPEPAPAPAPATIKYPTLPMPADESDEELEEDSMMMVRPPVIKSTKAAPKPKPRGKAPPKPKAAAKPRMANPKTALLSSSPAPEPAPEPAPKAVRRKKPVSESSFMGGIRPTVFDDDGSGKLEVNLDDASQGLGGKKAAVPRLVPNMASAFNREISPPKKRPAALGRLFGGK